MKEGNIAEPLYNMKQTADIRVSNRNLPLMKVIHKTTHKASLYLTRLSKAVVESLAKPIFKV